MSYPVKFLLCALAAFALSFALDPLVIFLTRKLKARQEILCYVDKHKSKSGTPTMGGISFLVASTVVTACFCAGGDPVGLIAAAVAFCYGLVGFLDDFIKVTHKENQGLKAYQKIIGQAGIAAIVTYYCYVNPNIGTTFIVPFTERTLDLGRWFLPVCFLLYVGVTNAVNLTDGLDGLVAKTSSVCFAAFGIVLFVLLTAAERLGQTLSVRHLASLGYFTFATLGAVLAFVWFNAHPARIFMGDTGSLALGAALTSMAVFSQNALLLPLVGIMYLVSCITVIVQVVSFKLRGKRVFLMAPYHHHLEYKGVKECKIVTYYTLITLLCATVAVVGILVR